jgi:dihydroorotase
MPNTNPATTSAEALADKLARARGRAWCHYGFFVGASRDNVDQLPELERMPGTPGVKIFMGSSTGTLLVEDDETLERVLRHGSRRVAVHSEDESRLRERRAAYVAGELDLPEGPSAHPFVRDPEAARLSTERLIALSERTGRPVHILHISTLDELPLIAEAKSRGLPVTCEVTPQHLWFAAPECYDRLGTRVQMNPPIRSGRHREAIRGALRDGLFDVFGSDHAPHTIEEKVLPYPAAPSGMPGVQTILPVLLTLALRDALFEPTLIAEMLGRRAADLFGIAGKGRIELGADADLAIVDPGTFVVEDSWLQSKCGWSPYSGETLHGRPVHVVLSGRPALRDGALVGSPRGEQLTFGDASYP